MREVYGVAAFRSRQHVMWFEAALRRRGIPVRVISTPRDIAMGCGLSVRFPVGDARQVRAALSEVNTSNLIGLYRAEYDGRRLWISPLREY